MARSGSCNRFDFHIIKERLVRAFGVEADFAAEEVKVTVSKVSYNKCARCWNQRPDVGSDEKHPDVCARCAKVLG